MRLRSIALIPAHGAGLDEALASTADAIAFALTDTAVPVQELRRAAADGLARVAGVGKTGIVILNHPRTKLLRDDVDALSGPNLSAVFFPHAVDPQDVRDLAVLLREFELARGIEPGCTTVFPVIDTARGLIRCVEIVQAAPRVGGLVFDARAYAADVGARAEENGPRLAYARGALVAAARAFEKRPLVVSEPLQLPHLAQYGFAGVVLPDARAASLANAAFSPSAHASQLAQHQVDAYEAARSEGAWVARLGSQVVDAHTARKARQSLE
ncbi:MAG: aldolase/citrate lyase family protein [Anaerolineaceae bacterium]